MSRTKRYFEEILPTISDEQLKKDGYSDEEIEFFRECFGPYEEQKEE